MNKFLLVALMGLASGCTTTKEKVFRDMALAGAAGLALGQNEDRYKNANSLLYASSFAAGAAVISLFINDPDKETERLRAEKSRLQADLDQAFNPTLTSELPGTLNGKIPEKYKGLIQPGEWKVYALDQWIEDGENRLIHQDKIMELIPPSLKPKQSKPQK